jgi:hypothetical protein
MSRQDKRRALLKSRISLACDDAADYIAELAALIKDRDAPNQPLEAIKNTLTRGDCPCRAALRLINESYERN